MTETGSTTRRTVLAGAVAAGAAAAAGAAPLPAALIGRSGLVQPALPWKADALDPVISSKTIEFHYGKHHAGYFTALAGQVKDSPLADRSLEEIVLAAAADPAGRGLFNNAAQAWNHNFYWQSLTPDRTAPEGRLKAALERDFGSLDEARAALARAAIGQFGSGWGWLVADAAGKLSVMGTAAADVPFTQGLKPLLTVDVWEHAYYLDWQNRRADHVNALVKDHLDWRFAAKNYAGLTG